MPTSGDANGAVSWKDLLIRDCHRKVREDKPRVRKDEQRFRRFTIHNFKDDQNFCCQSITPLHLLSRLIWLLGRIKWAPVSNGGFVKNILFRSVTMATILLALALIPKLAANGHSGHRRQRGYIAPTRS